MMRKKHSWTASRHRARICSPRVGLFAACVFLVACSRADGTSNFQPSPISQATTYTFGQPTLYPPANPAHRATKQAIIDAGIKRDNERATAVANWILGTRPVVTPLPIATRVHQTPVTGIHSDCVQGDSVFNWSGCWTGIGDGEYVYAVTVARKSDRLQGMLRVYTTTLDVIDPTNVGWYNVPLRVGNVRPIDAEWPLLTLRTVDHTPVMTFTFDLSTRQWVNP
jgi:hypothetical protein